METKNEILKMQVVINVIIKTFMFMFILFFILEIAYMGFLALLYRVPLTNNTEQIETVIENNSKEISHSFAQLIKRHFNGIQTNLLGFKQHINFMYNTNDTNTINSFKFNTNSDFYKSFKECIIQDKSKLVDYNFTSDVIEIMKKTNTKSEKISEILEKKYLNQIFLLKGDNTTPNETMITHICYALTYLKAQTTKRILLERENQTILNYTLFWENDIYVYPPKYIDKNIIKTMPFYDTQITDCNYQYSLKCFSLYHFDFYQIGNLTTSNSIFYIAPEVRDKSLLTNLCININPSTEKEQNDKFLCATYNISQTITNYKINSTEVVYDIIVDNQNNLELLFSSSQRIYDTYNYFKSPLYGSYQLTSDNIKLTLFHSIYYELEASGLLTDEQKKSIVKEYDENIKTINEAARNYSEGAFTEEYSKAIYVYQTYLDYQYNTKGERDNKKSKIRVNKYLYYLQRIITPNNSYKTNPIIFDTKSDSSIFYVVVKNRLVDPIKEDNIYLIYILKIFRSWVLFLSILFFGSILYFILVQFIMTCLLIPIKTFKRNITELIEKKPASNEDTLPQPNSNNASSISKITSSENNNVSDKQYKSSSKKIKDDFIFEYYTNQEIKEIESVIIFLKKILHLNNSDTPFTRKAEFYKSIASEIPKNLEIDLFKCQIIVGSCYLKVKQYSKAKNELENLQKRIEAKQKELKTKYEINEQKNRSLSTFFETYINEYTQDKITIDKDWISLMFISENCHYLLGLTNYFQFFALHKKMKQNMNTNLNTSNAKFKLEVSISQRQQKDYFLENAIVHFKAAFKINEHLQVNQIKNIVILLYLSKCYFHERRAKDDANKMLKKAIVVFAKFNSLIAKDLKDKIKVDPRIMLIVNGSLMEYIVYCIAKFAKKVEKYKVAYVAFQHFFHLSYFKNENLHCKALKAFKRINEIITEKKEDLNSKRKSKNIIKINPFEFQSQYMKKSSIDHLKIELRKYISSFSQNDLDSTKAITINSINDILFSFEKLQYDANKKIQKLLYKNIVSKYLNEYQNGHKLNVLLNSPLTIKPEEKIYKRINKFYRRISRSKSMDTPKAIIIIISETFCYNFNALKSYGILMINCINKFIDDDDLIGYMYFSENVVKDSIPLTEKSVIINQLSDKLINLKQNEQCDKENSCITAAFDAAIDMFIDKAKFDDDKYIFAFGQYKDIRYPNQEYTKSQTNKFNYLGISLYFFCFNLNRSSESLSEEEKKEKEEKINGHYRNFFRKFVEGYLIFVENFKMIKLGFANITYRGRQKNIFSSNLDNVNNII